ncbi:MAG TPA: FAD-dependent oxidoreductase [Acidimicrobiia bacterium]
MTNYLEQRRTVAVVGAGVAGLTAAYILQRSYDVTLYEAEPRLGGHAHTHDIVTRDGRLLAVDSGFIVYNERTYPNLIRLFGELGVETQPSDMTMSVRCEGCGLEYAGARGLGGVFAQWRNATDPRFVRMLFEIKRFHRSARRVLEVAADDRVTLGEFLASGRFSSYFVHHFMVPLVSCVWSCPPHIALHYPVRSLFMFLEHHGALSISGSPQWRTVVGGSRAYVERAAKGLTATELATPVRSVRRIEDGVELRDDSDALRRFDAAVIATHADEALALLSAPTPAERSLLGAFESSSNEAVLHTDGSLLPRSMRARASWNYLLDRCETESEHVRVSYHMNRLHQLDEPVDYLVTLNGGDVIPDDAVLARMTYAHPVYTTDAIAAQRRLPELSDARLAFAGAYHGSGFHEDGCASGVRAAASLRVAW